MELNTALSHQLFQVFKLDLHNTNDLFLEQGFDPQFGARPLKRLIQKEIVNTLSRRILAGDIDKSRPVLVDVFDNTVVFRNEENGQISTKPKEKKSTL